MTAVEWLEKQLTDAPYIHFGDLFEQAKEMENQMVIDIVEKSRATGLTAEYLLLTYGSKESDEYPEIEGTMAICNDIISSQTEISDESWEGCDGCTEQDKYFWTKGYQAGYNRATPKEISDDRTKLHWKTSLVVHTPEISDEEILDAAEDFSDSYMNRGVAMSSFAGGCYWYREQLKNKQ